MPFDIFASPASSRFDFSLTRFCYNEELQAPSDCDTFPASRSWLRQPPSWQQPLPPGGQFPPTQLAYLYLPL